MIFRLLFLMTISCGLSAHAHEGPHDKIHQLTHKIERGEKLTKHHFERAVEYRSIGKNQLAIKDLEIVTKQQPDHTRSLEILGKIHTSLNQFSKAKLRLSQALKTTKNKAELAGIHQSLAQVFFLESDLTSALKHNQQAIALAPKQEVDWYLFQSAIQFQNNQLQARAKALKQATLHIPSIVLTHAWIDAEIDAANTADVEKIVLNQLANSRYRSAWLIRSARISKIKSRPYRSQLQQAIKEINSRLNIDRPDLTILIERCHANYILGDTKQARSDYLWLKKLKISPLDLNYLSKITLHDKKTCFLFERGDDSSQTNITTRLFLSKSAPIPIHRTLEFFRRYPPNNNSPIREL